MILHFIRHAESVGNYELRLQGRTDYHLTDRGRQQAHAAADRLVASGIVAVYTSPLARTHQTAEIIASTAGVPLVPEIRLQEYDFGDEISGLTWDDIRKKHPDIIKALSTNDSDFPRYPGEEGRANFRDRVTAAVSEIIATHQDSPGRAIAIVTHAGPIVVYVLHSLGRRYSRPIPISIDNASITTVELNQPGNFAPLVVTRINDTCHLNAHTDAPALDTKAAG